MSGIIGVSPDMKSGVVGKYPVGGVVQVVNRASTTQYDWGSGTTSNGAASSTLHELHDYYITITPKYTSSHIYLTFSFTLMMYKPGDEHHFQIERENVGATTQLISSTGAGYNTMQELGSKWNTYWLNYTWVDTPAVADVAVKYQPFIGCSSEETDSHIRAGYQATSRSWAMEVAQ